MEKIFAERLRKAMQDKEYRQVDLLNILKPICEEKNIKCGKSKICQYLKGDFVPKNDFLISIAEALEVSPAWLIGFSNNRRGD